MKISNEFKTGLVVIAALAVGILFWVKTTDFNSRPYKVKTYFNYAEGVKIDSIVKLAGIEIGRVESIKFDYVPETKIELILSLDKKAKIHEDSIAFISTSGMIGDAYIGLTSGSTDKAFVKDGALIMSEDPVEMRKLMKKADAISENLDKTLIEVKSLVTDNKAKVENIAANLEETTANFKELSEDLKRHPWKLLTKGK
ncbi:MAG: MlaD family protein [Candidatus Omnitrophota bacterium]|jgi:phospholipid/cholesterol/gamma-HCH transport system substrate-binding protein